MTVNIVSQFQSSAFGENYNAPCSAVSLRWLSILFFVSDQLVFIKQTKTMKKKKKQTQSCITSV